MLAPLFGNHAAAVRPAYPPLSLNQSPSLSTRFQIRSARA
jgi:hypothetical protein